MPKISKIEVGIPKIKQMKRVAAYARVSNDTEVLLHSFSAQISHYSTLIQKNPEWTYVGVYADEGITGTNTDKRDNFKRLVADCDAGKIDIILTKSISRFARNTVDLLETVRHLKDIGVEVRFERENISSMNGDGELLLTILASFAQEESRSMSENIKWAIKKGFERGEPHSASRAFGYEWDGGQYRIVPKEAETIKYIFEQYLAGVSTLQLPKLLIIKGIVGINGNPLSRASIKDILQNEIYIGNLVLQKSYSPKIRKRKHNYGELQKYLVEEAHEPIISKELFQAVQNARVERGKIAPNKNKQITCFTGKIQCGKCGYKCSRRNITHSKTTERTSYKRWVCNACETKGRKFCDMQPVDEDILRMASTFVLGDKELDEERFQREVDMVSVFDDRIEFYLKNGKTKYWSRDYSSMPRGRTCFTGKVKCGKCGSKCIRNPIVHSKTIVREYYERWTCNGQRKYKMAFCDLKSLDEDELRKATATLLGDKKTYEVSVIQEVDEVILFDDKAIFIMKDGRKLTWQRE
ncbi:recombinase family protein [Anaerocolumna sp. MB42-C2]|uniref:recombinase family protein n=1 Tax=Anaerocolumna sp. MB42-C2 TaxID=3070997 RepID=UPI0027E0FE2C|nr:recombinase family protein [Anaerocolumna sp. MB42-C2]WMJ87807.1 recombinase family protein [Anaerocolumna sp. MB42-C2]